MESSIAPAAILSGILLILLFIGVPIAFVLVFLGLLACFFWIGTSSIIQIVQVFYATCSSDILLCLPLFLVMAEVVVIAGIGEDLFNSVKTWTGRLRGGVSAATIIGCGLFAAICGSSTARSFAAGTVAVGGTLGVMIPPSIIMILYGALADESIGKLFIAGVVPGILLTIGYVFISLMRGYVSPSIAPIPSEKTSLKQKIHASRTVFPFVGILIAMFWAFYTGVATPTEVAAVGVLASIMISLAMKRINLRGLYEATRKAGVTTAFVLFIIAGAKFFTFTISATGVSDLLTTSISNLGLSPKQLVLMMMFVYLIMGCFIDPAGMMTLTIPFFLPVLSAANVDLVWFGVLATINSELGYCTPPFGFNLFVLKGVAPPEVSIQDIILGVLPFLTMTFLLLILVLLFPQLALWLPSRM
jgi:tripartite ATP-independent transporter DctM subunit